MVHNVNTLLVSLWKWTSAYSVEDCPGQTQEGDFMQFGLSVFKLTLFQSLAGMVRVSWKQDQKLESDGLLVFDNHILRADRTKVEGERLMRGKSSYLSPPGC